MFDDIVKNKPFKGIRILCEENGVTEQELVNALPHPFAIRRLSIEQVYVLMESIIHMIIKKGDLQKSVNVV